MLVGQDGAGAGFAADADETAFMQAVVGNFQHANVIPYILAGVIGQGVELDQLALRGAESAVHLDHRDIGTGRALVLALTGNPGVHAGQLAPQGSDLADAAALTMAALVEVEQALLLHIGFQRLMIRGEDFDLYPVVLAHLLEESVGLRVQPAGVQGEDPNVGVDLPGHVQHNDVVGATEGQPEVVEVVHGQLQYLLG